MRKYLTFLVVALLALAPFAEAGWEEGVAAFQAGKLDTAAQEFQAVVEAQPEFAGGQFMLGQVLLRQKKNQAALEHLRKAYELETGNVSYQMALGQAYLANRRFSDTVQILERIDVSKLPKAKQEAYYQMLGAASLSTGDSDKALRTYKKMTEQNPQDADAWLQYGSLAYNARQVDTAVNALERAVQLSGNDPEALTSYSQALVLKARNSQGPQKKSAYNKAVAVAERLVSQNASYENLLFLGEVQLGAANYQDAVGTLKRAAAKNASDWHPHYYLSQAHTLLSQYDAAATTAQAALEKVKSADDRRRVWAQIGFAHEKQKNYDQAIEAYMKANNQGAVQRVQENKRIAEENISIEQENRQIQEMEAERKRLEEELKQLGGPPRR